MMLKGRLNRLGPASADLTLAILARFRPDPGLAQAGPDLKIVCFTVLMPVFYFWFPGRFWPGLDRGRAYIWLKRLSPNRPSPRPGLDAQPAE